MSLRILALAVIFALTGAAGAGGDKTDDLDRLRWLVGAWSEKKGAVETQEHWIAPQGGLMLGVNRTVRTAGKSSFEFLRIAKTQTGISYFASPGGRPPVEFPLIESKEDRAVFENPKHDFPQRIIYTLAKDGALHARIEGTIGGKARSMEWRWEKMK